MSKRDLKKYLSDLTKDQLEEQVLDLYLRFNEVKTFYNFVFKPKEDKLLEEAKFKISKEYFPVGRRKPKARRSVAQKFIKHFIQLGVDAYVIAEIMVFNIEIAQQFANEKVVMPEAFYKSMLKSFEEALVYIKKRGMQASYFERLSKIAMVSKTQNWLNYWGFEYALEDFNKPKQT